MGKLSTLVSNISKDGKLDEEEILGTLSDFLERSNSGNDDKAYRCLYEKAYGRTIIKELAETYVKSFAVTDDSDRPNGMKWTAEQAYTIGNDMNVDWDKFSKWDWFVVLNMMYSDYYKTAKKFEHQDETEFFASLACDWLCDSDAPKDKLYRYYFGMDC